MKTHFQELGEEINIKDSDTIYNTQSIIYGPILTYYKEISYQRCKKIILLLNPQFLKTYLGNRLLLLRYLPSDCDECAVLE